MTYRCKQRCPYGKIPCEYSAQDYEDKICLRKILDEKCEAIEEEDEFILAAITSVKKLSVKEADLVLLLDRMLKKQQEKGKKISLVGIKPIGKDYSILPLLESYTQQRGYRLYLIEKEDGSDEKLSWAARFESCIRWISTKECKGIALLVDNHDFDGDGEVGKLFCDAYHIPSRICEV